MQSKKFINSEEFCVQESITGLATVMNAQIDLIYQGKVNADEIPIVSIKRNVLQTNDKVRLICGGGSGHEPAHGGFVCEQMLSGAVCGRVFASPSL
jgi:dihydroxyacetone kinase